MYYIYLIKDKNNKLYVGYSSNLKRRITEHKAGKVDATQDMNEPGLFYYEAYTSKEKAKEREAKLKQYGSSYRGLLKRLQ